MKKQERIMKNLESLKKNVPEYYSLENFIEDAKSYIKSIKEGRMIVNIASVSKSGMTRRMTFEACIKARGENRYRYRQYVSFFKTLGVFNINKNHELVVHGCGMDMIFHVNYTTIHQLCRLGFISKKQCGKLAQMTPQYI